MRRSGGNKKTERLELDSDLNLQKANYQVSEFKVA